MLNLGVDINIDISNPRLPLHFENRNTCVHCGADNSLEFIDKFGRLTNKEINAFDHIKCKKCGRIYSILWEPKEGSDKMYPSAVEFNIGKQFNNLMDRKNIKYNGVEQIG